MLLNFRKLALFVLLAISLSSALFAEITFTDALNKKNTLSNKAIRIISLSPAITENLFASGAGKYIVGATTYCDYPKEALSIKRVGGYSAKTVNLELIIELKPDLILGEKDAHASLAQAFSDAKLNFAFLKIATIQEVSDTLTLFGKIAGDTSVAEKTIQAMNLKLNTVKNAVLKIDAGKKPLVFWETWDEPLMSANKNTFVGMAIEIAGGVNVFSDTKTDWPMVSLEELLAKNPDFIMSSDTHGDKVTLDALIKRPGFSSLKAVMNKKVILLDGNTVSRPTARLADACVLMFKAMYPEVILNLK